MELALFKGPSDTLKVGGREEIRRRGGMAPGCRVVGAVGCLQEGHQRHLPWGSVISPHTSLLCERLQWPWRSHPAGLMFWLSRKRFVGSYLSFTATSRAYLVGL